MTTNGYFGLTEIRLEIYSYLLIAYPSRFAPREGVTVRVDCVWYEDQPKAIAINRTGCHSGVFSSTGLAPQILRTCKAINREATPMLYGENIFRFQPIKDDVFRHERFAKEKLEASCRELYSNPVALWTEGAASIPNHPTFAVLLRQIGLQNATSLKKLMFVTREAYHSKSTQEAGQAIQMVTQLLKAHTPGLRWVAICRGLNSWDKLEHGLSEIDKLSTRKYDTRTQSSTPREAKISVNRANDESWANSVHDTVGSFANEVCENLRTEGNTDYKQLPGSHADEEERTADLPPTFNSNAGGGFEDEDTDGIPRIPRALRREEQEAMHEAVADMIQEITWLKQLSFAGFDKDVSAYEKMKKLQALVKTRR